jgi:UDP-glucose 4-epimerase/UDP-arabinose 4-epimerase
MTTVLVVGGAGYIGSHTCKQLSRQGFAPVALDNLCRGHESFVRWGPFVRADVRDTETVADTIRRFNVQAVLHFAAFAYVGESVAHPAIYFGNNVTGTLSLLEAMRATDCQKIVFSSTCAIYGEPEVTPIAEQCPKAPVNPYGRSKLMCEAILADYAAAYGMECAYLRYFNACGADPDGQIGELRDPETHLIPRALMSLLGHIHDFEVFGADFPTPDGTAIRDYIHVVDLADAHVLALQRLLQGAPSDAFNLGTGVGYSVKEVLDMVSEVTGRMVPAATGPRRPGDPACLVADPSKANSALGFSPKRSDLETIVRTAWRWHQKAHPQREYHALSAS